MLFEQIESNKRKTVWFIILFFLLVQMCGFTIGILAFEDAYAGLRLSTYTLLIYMTITLFNAQFIVMSMNHAKKIQKEDYPILVNIVEELCISAGLTHIPDIYIIQEDSPNAFATGFSPEKSAIAVTTALLEKLNREELESVIAHELGHIINYDIRVSTVSLALLSCVIFLCDVLIDVDEKDNAALLIPGLLFLIIAPVIAQIIHFAISRNREYLADATAVKLTRNPQGLISALIKIDNDPDIVDNISKTCASMYIADPLKKRFDKYGVKKEEKMDLFSTHPSIEDRIERLRNR